MAIQEAAECHVAAAEDAVPLVAPPAVPAAVTEQKAALSAETYFRRAAGVSP